MRCCSFNGWVGHHEFLLGVGSFAWAHATCDWGALGQRGNGALGVCLAAWIRGLVGGLGRSRLGKIPLVYLTWGLGYAFGRIGRGGQYELGSKGYNMD